MIKLSIIIPCYNAEPYIQELLNRLAPQITDEVEVLVIDDGSKVPFMTGYEWANVIHKENGGASSARNKGLDLAKGEYVAFIDADDLVSENYVKTILNKIDTEHFDYCYLSWKTLPGGWNCDVKLRSIKDTFPPFNFCVWNRIYKRSMIGKTRFNVKKLIAEDAEFIRKVKEEGKQKAFISDYMYFYRGNTPDSLTKKFKRGELNTKRIVYYFNRVTKDMEYLIDEFKKADKDAEVILLTNHNDIPELNRYAMVMPPVNVTATEKRGEDTHLINVLPKAEDVQVIIYTSVTYQIGGIETFIYTFCETLHKYYDILVLYDGIDHKQLERLQRIVRCMKNDPSKQLSCDTLINNRISDEIPKNVRYKQSIQMVHGCKQANFKVPTNRTHIVTVSQAVKDSYTETEQATVIQNLVSKPHKAKKVLRLISATRLDTWEKGKQRMIQLAKLLNECNIPFLWVYFSNVEASNIPGFVRVPPTLDIMPYIADSDYLVQLSDTEAFCYSIVEALQVGTPVISTPLPVLEEIGVKDGVNAHILPFEHREWTRDDVRKLLNIPTFEYSYDNAPIVKKWRKLLGNTKPTGDYRFEDLFKDVEVIQEYFDVKLKRTLTIGERVSMTKERADEIINKGFLREITDGETDDLYIRGNNT